MCDNKIQRQTNRITLQLQNVVDFLRRIFKYSLKIKLLNKDSNNKNCQNVKETFISFSYVSIQATF